jgi:spermidine/putrescine transport system substrate-binding protein
MTEQIDPRTEFLKQAMSRRGFMSAVGATGAAAALAACGTSSEDSSSEASGTGEQTSGENVVWANWTAYLDRKKGTYPTLEAFQKESGYTVDYKEDIDDNATFNGKVEPQLQNGQYTGYDMVTLTDWLAGEWIRKGYVAQIDDSLVPNKKNILPALLDVAFDPGRQYSLTWQSGFAGLAWNKARVPDGLKTVDDLWQEALKGKVVVLSEMRDTMGIILLSQGVDISQGIDDAQFQAGLDELKKQIDSGQIKQVKGNSYLNDLKNEQAWAAIAWSGDIFQINAEEGDQWEFVLPESGGTLWSDNLLMPTTSQNMVGSEAIMDYYYDPKVAAEVAAWVNYICPVQGAQEEMEKIDPDLANSEWIFPTDEILSNAYVFPPLTPEQDVKYSDEFGRVISG